MMIHIKALNLNVIIKEMGFVTSLRISEIIADHAHILDAII